MKELFKDIVDSKFTAKMEEDLDLVAEGKLDYVTTLEISYGPFEKNLETPNRKWRANTPRCRMWKPMKSAPIAEEKWSQKQQVRKISCLLRLSRVQNHKIHRYGHKGFCPKCGKPIVERKSKRGYKYYGCEDYKDCKFMTWDVPTDELWSQVRKDSL